MAPSATTTEAIPPLSGHVIETLPGDHGVAEFGFKQSDTLNQVAGTLHAAIRSECDVDALVWMRRQNKADPPQTHRLVDRLPPETHAKLCSQLDSLCRRADASRSPCQRVQLAPHRLTIAVPVDGYSDSSGVIGMIVVDPAPDPSSTNRIRDRLIEIARKLSLWEMQQRVDEEQRIADHSAATVELITKILICKTSHEAAQTIAAELDRFLPVNRVIVGFGKSKSSGIRELVASDSARIDLHSARATLLIDAMNESLRSGEINQFDSRTDGLPNSFGERIAGELAMHVTSVPLGQCESEPRAVVLLAQDHHSDHQSVRRYATAAQDALATAFRSVATTKSVAVLSRLRQRLRSNLFRVMVCMGMFCTGTLFIPVTHRVTCDALIEPKHKRFVVAPFDASLDECFVQPGDLVLQGDRLAKLDERELQWERIGLQADRDQAIKRRDSARASRKFAQQRIAQLEIDRINSELDWLDHRLSELEITSPIDGIVVTGDLTRASGAPLQTGEAMFEIAPLGEMLVEIGLADHQLTSVKVGHSINLRLDAYPSQHWNSRIDVISPRSEIRGKESVFISEAVLENQDRNLRPGMTGRVKIDCGKRRLGWVMFHRPWESLVTWLFW